jgi:hypothetical protein
LPGLALNLASILPISASQIARIIGISHWHPALTKIFKKGNKSDEFKFSIQQSLNYIHYKIKKTERARNWWLMPVILAT